MNPDRTRSCGSGVAHWHSLLGGVGATLSAFQPCHGDSPPLEEVSPHQKLLTNSKSSLPHSWTLPVPSFLRSRFVTVRPGKAGQGFILLYALCCTSGGMLNPGPMVLLAGEGLPLPSNTCHEQVQVTLHCCRSAVLEGGTQTQRVSWS